MVNDMTLRHASSTSLSPTDQRPAARARCSPQPAQQLQRPRPSAPHHRQPGAGHLQPHGAPACHGDPEARKKGNPRSLLFLLGKLPKKLNFIHFSLEEGSAKGWDPAEGCSCFSLWFSFSSWFDNPGREFMITLTPSNCLTIGGIVVLGPTALSLLLISLPLLPWMSLH